MADEVGSAALSAGQKAIEVSAELIKLLAPLAGKLMSATYHMSVDGINGVGEKISDIKSKCGIVARKDLLSEAQKAGYGISTTSNVLSSDVTAFAEKAKQYNIPISVVGSGDKQTIDFLDRDKDVIGQITQELMQERLKEAPQSVKCFTVSQNTIGAMKAAFDEHGVDCQFMQAADGKIKCIYPAEYAEQVDIIKAEYKQMHKEVADNLTIQKGEDSITITDDKIGKSFSFGSSNKAQTMEMLKKEFGYSEAKANLSANKICRDLGLDKKKFFDNSKQYDNLNSLKTNIRYQSDDAALQNVLFNAVNFRDGENTHIVIQNGDKTAALTPAQMSETEMKNICKNQLGMSDYQVDKAVEKAAKIDHQVRVQIEERSVSGKKSQEISIERTSDENFVVSSAAKSKVYNLNTVNIEDKIAKDFGIPKENAKSIVKKAQSQSALQNKISKFAKKKPAEAAGMPKFEKGKGIKH